ncbi:hypothetical protein BS35_003748 [Actinomadura glauciflava]|nr:hypothetical protein [Actinomadura glauciflava]
MPCASRPTSDRGRSAVPERANRAAGPHRPERTQSTPANGPGRLRRTRPPPAGVQDSSGTPTSSSAASTSRRSLLQHRRQDPPRLVPLRSPYLVQRRLALRMFARAAPSPGFALARPAPVPLTTPGCSARCWMPGRVTGTSCSANGAEPGDEPCWSGSRCLATTASSARWACARARPVPAWPRRPPRGHRTMPLRGRGVLHQIRCLGDSVPLGSTGLSCRGDWPGAWGRQACNCPRSARPSRPSRSRRRVVRRPTP